MNTEPLLYVSTTICSLLQGAQIYAKDIYTALVQISVNC